MKKHITILALALACLFSASAQQAYWVFLADKAGTTFDPYTYFDAKAIERYQQCGADLYDITNYPVSAAYEQGVSALATEEIGASRWMNALGVMATPDQVLAIEALPYVLRVQPIEGNGLQLADCNDAEPLDGLFDIATVDGPLEAQLVRMGGKASATKASTARVYASPCSTAASPGSTPTRPSATCATTARSSKPGTSPRKKRMSTAGTPMVP